MNFCMINHDRKASVTPKKAFEAHFKQYQASFKARQKRAQAIKPSSQLALFRSSNGEFENPFLASNQEGWIRKAEIFESFLTDETVDGWVPHNYLVELVPPNFLPAELLFDMDSAGEFVNPFLVSRTEGWVRKTEIEEEEEPLFVVDPFAEWDEAFGDQPGAESHSSYQSIGEAEDLVALLESLLSSELLRSGSFTDGDDEQFESRLGGWAVSEDDDEIGSSTEDSFAGESYPSSAIDTLDSVMDELTALINEQLLANNHADIDVDALAIDVENLD